MKKYLSLLLALLLSLSLLSACGGGTEEAPDDGASNGPVAESDLAYVQDKGVLTVGITDFAPMDYQEEGSDEWIGFDADLAKAFAASLGVSVEFVEITWDTKAIDLETKGIDAVWNGMTLTEEVRSLMGVGTPYCKNAQVVVAPNGTTFADTDSLINSGLSFAAENGSAGAEALDDLGIAYTACDTQAKALMEVASGSSQVCVIDLLMAGAMIGEGTSYPDLAASLELTSEEYVVGFRMGSDLVDAFNEFWTAACADGTVNATATQYGVAQNVIAG